MNILPRKKRSMTAESKEKSVKVPTHGSLEVFLANEGFLGPAEPQARRPPTSASRLLTSHSSRPSHSSRGKPSEETLRRSSFSTISRTKSLKSFAGFGEGRDEPNSHQMRANSKRPRNWFTLHHTMQDLEEEKTNLVPEWPLKDNIKIERVANAPPSNYFKRFMNTASGRTPSPSIRNSTAASNYAESIDPPPLYRYSVHEDDSLTALPSFPGSEKDIRPVLPQVPPPDERVARGAAARAAAAAQNELHDSMRYLGLAEPQVARDSESGVGIEVRDRSEVISGFEFDIPVLRIDPIFALPEELVGHMLSFLDASSLVNAELVSHSWHASANSRHVWREIYRAECQNQSRGIALPLSHPSGLPPQLPGANQDWKSMCRARKALQKRWTDNHAAAIYLEGHTDSVYCVQFDKDKILTGSRDRTIRVWDARTYACIKILGVPSRGVGSTVPPLPADVSIPDHGHRPFIKVFSPRTTIEPDPVVPYLYHNGSILCLQYDDTLMVTGSSDCTLVMWDVHANYKPYRRLRRHTAGVLDVCFDAIHIVSCSKDATVCLWDRRTGEFLRKLTGHRGPVNAVQLRADLVVSASGDGIAKLWNLTSGLCIKEFPSRDRGMACVEFSPDSRTILAGGNDQVIYQFDASTGDLVREMKGHEGLVRSLHLDSASGRIVSGSYDTSVRAYDLRTGETVVDFKKWTSSWILSAKADYRRIVATSQDSRAVVMDFGYQLDGVEALEV